MILTSKVDSNVKIDIKTVEANRHNEQKIALIKDYRQMTKYGLKESKLAVEGAWHSIEAMRKLFMDASTFPYDASITKKQMMNIVEKALDGMSDFYISDKVECLELLLKNIRDRAKEHDIYNPEAFLSKKYEDFINGL